MKPTFFKTPRDFRAWLAKHHSDETELLVGFWSAVNIKRMGELIAEGRVAPAGATAFERRDEKRSEVYSFERKMAAFDQETLARFKKEKKAWDWFSTQAPSYQRVATHWVTSAKRPETREKRLGTLIACSKKNERIPAAVASKQASS